MQHVLYSLAEFSVFFAIYIFHTKKWYINLYSQV